MAKRSVGLVKCEFIFDFDTDAALKRIEKNEKMRRTGQNPRRTGQREGNGGKINHNRKGGAFEIEQPKVGPKGEPSGSERVKG